MHIVILIIDTQEAPKSLSLASSSSLESLASLDEEEENGALPPPPLPRGPLVPGLRASGAPGAFTSYVRRRGEPDGRTACAAENNNVVNKVHNIVSSQKLLSISILFYILHITEVLVQTTILTHLNTIT